MSAQDHPPSEQDQTVFLEPADLYHSCARSSTNQGRLGPTLMDDCSPTSSANGRPSIWFRVQGSIYEQLLRRNVKRFRGGLIFKAHRRLYHSAPGLGFIKKKQKMTCSSTSSTNGRPSICLPSRSHKKQRFPTTLQQDYA